MKINRKHTSLFVTLAILFVGVGGICLARLVEPVAAGNIGGPTITVVATVLNNPRGLTFGPDGALYIAEAGSGGSGPCGPGPEGDRCYGETGSVYRVELFENHASRVIQGLPSLATPDGGFATGVHDISFNGLGNAAFTTGFAGDPADRTGIFGPAGSGFARLGRMNAPAGKFSLMQDLGGYESEINPTGDEVDSNPYGVLALAGRTVYTDAGGNALNQVSAKGAISNLATFPNRMVLAPPFLELPPGTLIPMDTVPTSVAQGPDGAFYVGQLTGFPFPVNDANVYRIPANGGPAEVYAGGFTAVIDVAFGPDGSMYVLEIAKNGLLAAFEGGDWGGALIRVAPDGTRTEIAPNMLNAPGGVAVGPDGALYVTTNSISSGFGQVVRIEQ